MTPVVRTRRGCLSRQDARGDQGARLSKLRISIAHDDDSVRVWLGRAAATGAGQRLAFVPCWNPMPR